MNLWKDIIKIFKTMLIVLCMVLCLSACKSDKGDISGAELEGEESELDEQQRMCWQANLLEMFYNAMAESSMKAYPKVTKSAMSFMMVAFAIWLSIRLLKHVSSLVEESPAEVWTEISRMAFMCLLCGTLASSTSFLIFTLNKFIFPVYYAFLEYGSRIMELAAGAGSNETGIKGQVIGDTCLFYTNSLICAANPLTPITAGAPNPQFPSEPSDLMQCMACATSDRLQIGFVLSKELLAATSLTSWIVGMSVFCIFLFVKIAFVFYLVDSIFRMNIVTIILPFLILAVPFKFSRGWAKEGVLTIFNSAACMMCIAIIATMSMLAMQTMINDNHEAFGDKHAYEEFGTVALSILLIAFLISKSLGLAVSLAGSLVGGGGDNNFQKKIGKLAVWTAKKALVFITGAAGKMFTNVIEKNQKLREIRNKVQEMNEKKNSFLNKISGRDRL